jgi:hypothetical protein
MATPRKFPESVSNVIFTQQAEIEELRAIKEQEFWYL